MTGKMQMTRGSWMPVVALAAITAGAIGCVTLTGARAKAKVNTTQMLIKDTERRIVQDRIEHGSYPRILEPIPLDSWGRPLRLEVPGEAGRPYRVVSYGADGMPGGRGTNADISNWEF